MAECGEISMMLGAFEDSELEPNEMQEVAFHLARCESCTGILADYSTLGRDLRSIAAEPSLAGFSSAVIARVDRLPQPVFTRIARFLRRQADSVGTGFAWSGAVAAVAVMTIILMTPYARQFANRGANSTTAIATAEHEAAPAANQVAQATANEPTMADNDSHADISRLESENHSVAVWSEPRRDTTVIWLPDQP
ncbi:MAG TPA: zf-HC2 domain-containing protein [Candidatus Binatus sp.]|uniref:anti-sigma factor family protein n=1 Tax=Candidatus Binatus sp. TaxID=2811406 RepID=UPI002B496610|nr:zf-HC2 domain-containing protein [Candidatus Binatus sp.]HKN11693.1 zf-HC2 domain-containing protein [Candidatus Binatus sp.]